MTTHQLAVVLLLAATPAAAQSSGWTTTDVGAVTLTGGATETNGAWTISGDGSDIWDTADSFQFVHRPLTRGIVQARVLDMQNTSPFAKAGVMMRSSLRPDAATVIFNAKPDGHLELMRRVSDSAPMEFLSSFPVTLPAWLRLAQSSPNSVTASISYDGLEWAFVGPEVPITWTGSLEVGVVVTSHDPGQLNTAHFSHLSSAVLQPDWLPVDVGDVGVSGHTGGSLGFWNVSGAGADIWGSTDAFQFLYRYTGGTQQHLTVRVNSLQNTNPFAKAGLMIRLSLDPDAPTVILDVKPDGGVELMHRSVWGGEMAYLGGATVTLPAWLDLSWDQAPGAAGTSSIKASVSQDKVTWLPVPGLALFPSQNEFELGLAVTSHDASTLTTARFQGLSLLPLGVWSDDIGSTGLVGNATTDFTHCCNAVITQGAGADIWGTADSFEFIHGAAADASLAVQNISFQVLDLQANHAFAKAGLMFRDSLAPDAMQVVLDLKPDGGVEFMARQCTGCPTAFISGAKVTVPALLQLSRNGASYQAFVLTGGPQNQPIGSVDVPMATPISGYAVTSHDMSNIATATFAMPPTPVAAP